MEILRYLWKQEEIADQSEHILLGVKMLRGEDAHYPDFSQISPKSLNLSLFSAELHFYQNGVILV